MNFALALALSLNAAAAEPRTLSLDEALKTAAQNQPTLRQQHASTDAAAARADEAFAPNLPQVNASASYRLSTTNTATTNNGAPVLTGAPTTSQLYASGITATQTLWDFQQTWGRYRAAEFSADAQADTERANGVIVAENTRVAYFGARAQRDLVEVAKSTLKNQQDHLDQIQGFVSAGRNPEIDLAQARANVANARVQLITAKNNYATSKAKLNQAMGVERPTDYEVVDSQLTPIVGEDGELDALVNTAYSARPESAAYEAQARAEEYTLRSIRGAYWPSFAASLGGTLSGSELSSLEPNVSGQLSLNWQLYGGGITNAQVREAESNLVIIQAQRDAFHLQVRLDVEQAQLALHGAEETLIASDDALAAAKAQLTLAEGRYQAGVGNIIELSDAQAAVTSAAAQRVSALYSVATARAQLMAALGLP